MHKIRILRSIPVISPPINEPVMPGMDIEDFEMMTGLELADEVR